MLFAFTDSLSFVTSTLSLTVLLDLTHRELLGEHMFVVTSMPPSKFILDGKLKVLFDFLLGRPLPLFVGAESPRLGLELKLSLVLCVILAQTMQRTP